MTASVKNPFQTIHGKQIQLVVTASTDDFLDISICNLNFRADINKHSLQIIGWAVTFILYGILLHFNNIIVNAVFAILLLWTVYGILHVVEKETILFLRDFSLQISTKYFGSSKHVIIPIDNIYDIIIEETINKCQIIYMLVVLTKGHYFQFKPIIPMLSETKPRVDCLRIVYNLLQTRLKSID